jgi:glutamine phosphoribosylpyrophosphate amidotransferase
VITPLQDADLKDHPNSNFLKNLKQTCRPLIIDGPNCVIGCLPDHSVFMVQDRKKLRPGVVGGKPGIYAFASEICGLDAAIPNRDKSKDIFNPCIWIRSLSVRVARRLCYGTRKTHYPFHTEHQGFTMADIMG